MQLLTCEQCQTRQFMYVDGPVNDSTVTKTPGVKWVEFWVRVDGSIEMKRLREVLPAAAGLSPRDFMLELKKYDSMYPIGIMKEEEAQELASRLQSAGLQTQMG